MKCMLAECIFQSLVDESLPNLLFNSHLVAIRSFFLQEGFGDTVAMVA